MAEDHAAEQVVLSVSDPTWPGQFADEVNHIQQSLGEIAQSLRFEHVGSTAVAGLIAKPVIDILVIPPTGQWPHDRIQQPLAALGYQFWSGNPNPFHLFFVKGMPPYGSKRTHHLHVRPIEQALPVLHFRDYLRDHPETAQAYARLKQRLAVAHVNDREAYTSGKDEFIADILRRAADA